MSTLFSEGSETENKQFIKSLCALCSHCNAPITDLEMGLKEEKYAHFRLLCAGCSETHNDGIPEKMKSLIIPPSFPIKCDRCLNRVNLMLTKLKDGLYKIRCETCVKISSSYQSTRNQAQRKLNLHSEPFTPKNSTNPFSLLED